ncbi:hypothetical protein [Pseudoalteromonas tunicata]|nr:hypothetical protein [Pseudoalteromonas tunicata]ATC95668.1 hypothetical protein PTUN_a3319 [Pseudoalteromonas tunicata]MDP4985030.1 hypothetical protein [Pseudoalteromonas tunicata]MDP5214877.1 hypothetical protein [Pseudoalteromonas tunicata]
MKLLMKWCILIGLLTLALVFYSAGSVEGGIIFFVLGALFEIAFWFKLMKVNKPSKL